MISLSMIRQLFHAAYLWAPIAAVAQWIALAAQGHWWCHEGYIFFPGLFFTIFSYFGSFMVVCGFGVGVLYWVFGVGVFS